MGVKRSKPIDAPVLRATQERSVRGSVGLLAHESPLPQKMLYEGMAKPAQPAQLSPHAVTVSSAKHSLSISSCAPLLLGHECDPDHERERHRPAKARSDK